MFQKIKQQKMSRKKEFELTEDYANYVKPYINFSQEELKEAPAIILWTIEYYNKLK
jgi:hypothetical protein